ncbi:hypothetical protein [Brevibacillus sp. NRS-1366]|uniref:hypothetical protein n=1 Tax=Brevibacillus sp. NRS-1366 TaxID=3233899 RepID=UPI003D1E9F67
MSGIIPFVSLIGVIVGFGLSLLKDWLTNRPKMKAETSNGKFEYYNKYYNEEGIHTAIRCEHTNANILNIQLVIDIYNVGKVATAVKEIIIEVENKGLNSKKYLQPELSKGENKSFNVSVGSIITKELSLSIAREEDTEVFFNDIILDPNSDGRLLITVHVKDIYGNQVSVIVEPFSIVTAY